jgi:hypothetical protein
VRSPLTFQLTVHLTLAGKRPRDLGSEDVPNRTTKWQREQGVAGVPTEQVDHIERWLDNSCPPRTPSIENKAQHLVATDTMPRKPDSALLSPEDNSDRATTVSRKSDRSAASVHDSDYRQSLRQRNIYVNREDPPPELMRRARRIISRPRASPRWTMRSLND